MAEIVQEALLPYTDAIPRATVEFECRGRKVLVRYKARDGHTWQRQIADRDEAFAVFSEFVGRLEKEAKARR